MVQKKKVCLGIFGVAAIAALSPSYSFANAAEGKIYLNGRWVDAQPAAEEKSFSAQFFHTVFESEALPDLRQLALRFVNQNASVLQSDGDTAWGIKQSQTSEDLQTERLSKTWRGLPVLGGEALVHVKDGKIAFASADDTSLVGLTDTVRIKPSEAQAIAYASYGGQGANASAPELKVLVRGEETKTAALVYQITVHDRDQLASDVHYVDAQTGQELLVTTNVQTIADRKIVVGTGQESDWDMDETQWKTLYADKGCDIEQPAPSRGGSLWGALNGRGSNAAAPAPKALKPCYEGSQAVMASAQAAWNNSGLVHAYFHKTYKRNSIDGNGLQLKSVVNFVGAGFPNAAWYNDKNLMLYGVGDAAEHNDFALPLDVAAHEFTHGITSRTAGLEYADESGALNESYSDVFGKLVAFQNNRGADWKLGRELYKDNTRFVRDMENPAIGHTSQYKYRGQQCHRLNDFCGVHSNSGIPNKAAVLLAKRIGNEKLGRLYYLTLTQLLKPFSTFREARAQTEAACGTLFGPGSQDCKAVSDSFAAVGIE